MHDNAEVDLFVGVDIGTSGCRAVAINEHGHVCAESHVDWPPPLLQDGYCEYDPEVWWHGVLTVLRELAQQCDPGAIRGVALDATSATVLLANANGSPIGPALMYNDRRADTQADWLRDHIPDDVAAHGASSGLAKLLWLTAAHGDNPRVRYFLHQADWLLGRLCGRYGVSDHNNALKTGYDAASERWPAWFGSVPVSQHWLPEVHPPATPVGYLRPEIANTLGLSTSVQVVTGTTDSTAAFLATGASQIGDAVTSLGSTLVIKVLSQSPVHAAEFGVYSQRLDDNWLVGGASNSGGNVLRAFFSEEAMQALTPSLAPDHPTGLDYYPLVQPGERFPYNDAQLQPRVSPRPASDVQFFQGLLEGIARIEYTGYQRLAELGAPWPTSIRSLGGGSRNTAWTQIRQRLLGVPLLAPVSDQAAYGAALLARRGVTNTS